MPLLYIHDDKNFARGGLLHLTFIIRKPFHVNSVSHCFYSLVGSLQNNSTFVVCQLVSLPPPILALQSLSWPLDKQISKGFS